MSCNWAGYHNIGLVLRDDELRIFLENYAKLRVPGIESDEPLTEKLFDTTPLQDYEFIKSSLPCIDGEIPVVSGDDCFYIIPLREEDTDGRYFQPFQLSEKQVYREGIAYSEEIPAYSRTGDLWLIPLDTDDTNPWAWIKAYPDITAILQECKDKLKRYLPDDFNWYPHIGIINYAA